MGSRVFLSQKFSSTSFFDTTELIYNYYPSLRKVHESKPTRGNGVLDILLLGGSVLHPNNGEVEEELRYQLKEKYPEKNIKLHNVAAPAHNSRDSKWKMDLLKDHHFDLVIFYHGINEARANNCSKEVFKEDYTHFKWYSEIEGIVQRPLAKWTAIPVAYNYLSLNIHQRIFPRDFIPKELPYKGWSDYGNEIKTVKSFKDNINAIQEQVNKMETKLLIPTFTYWLEKDYSFEKFKEREKRDERPRMPVKIWGKHENVVKAIAFHNQVILDKVDENEDVIVTDLHAKMPKGELYFDDICHLSKQGSKEFARLLTLEIEKIIEQP